MHKRATVLAFGGEARAPLDRGVGARATYREFDADSDRVALGTSYMFGRDGVVRIRREQFMPHSLETATSTTDVSANYVPAPKFGAYDELLTVGRSTSV